MKITLKPILLLVGVLSVSFLGCRKHDDGCMKHDEGIPTTIVGTNLSSPKPGTVFGTFTATGAFKSSGDYVMLVTPVGTDSIHCELELTAHEGTFHIAMDCEAPPQMNGAWKITGGTNKYKFLRGGGTLIMMFPPDVPAGVISIETMTGIASRHP